MFKIPRPSMVKWIFSKSELELLKKIETKNSDELIGWMHPNVIFPVLLIALSILGYALFKSDPITWTIAANILLNGSLVMFSLNRLNSVSINLFKFDKTKEEKAKTNTYNLRAKVDDYSKILIILISFFYVYQVINIPFQMNYGVILQFIILAGVIYFSLRFSKFAFLLQSRLVERTLGDEIRDEAAEGRNHLNEKYGS